MADIYLTRYFKNNTTTVGEFVFDNNALWSLEDVDRGLEDDMPSYLIRSKKKFGVTAIPYGRYEIVINYSEKFKMMMPLLLKVKGFSGIRIHILNSAVESEGCIGIGLRKNDNNTMILDSKPAFKDVFMPWLLKTLNKEKVFINIIKPTS